MALGHESKLVGDGAGRSRSSGEGGADFITGDAFAGLDLGAASVELGLRREFLGFGPCFLVGEEIKGEMGFWVGL